MLELDAIQTAIRSIEDSRESHREWIGHDANACETCRAAPADVAGDDAHHLACIAKYDQVLVVLREVAALRAVLETAPEELAEHVYVIGGLHGSEEWRQQSWQRSSALREENILYARATLAYLTRKAGVTP